MTKMPMDRREYPAGLSISRWRAPDGWDHRRFDWPADPSAPARGSMIYQAGRGDYFEKYIETLDEWHRRGWNLRGFDWRGQAGSGRLLGDRSIGHIESFDTWVADLDVFVKQWLAETPRPHVIVSHSMGGQIVMRHLIAHRPPIDAAVFSAPMLAMSRRPFGRRFGRWMARLALRLGQAESHAWQENERPMLPGSSRQKLLTHDLDRYADETSWIERLPDHRIGPPSWRWVSAAYSSSSALFAPGSFERVSTPVLLLGAVQDRLVSPRGIEVAARRLPDARLHMHPFARHELFRETDDIREPIMAKIAAFLDEKAPPR